MGLFNKPQKSQRRGLALMVAIFVMVITSTIVVTTLDTSALQYTANRNTIAWDKARYLAEAGTQHALALLEADDTWRTGISATEFPSGSGCTYTVTVADGASSTVIITASGTASGVTRNLVTTVIEQ